MRSSGSGASLREIQKGDTLSSIAHEAELTLEIFAEANAERRIFRKNSLLEIPRHQQIPASLPDATEKVRKRESKVLTKRTKVAIRDLLTANANTAGLLAVTDPPQKMVYAASEDGTRCELDVLSEDTLATVTQRFAQILGDPSLKPADVGAYEDHARNEQLLEPA